MNDSTLPPDSQELIADEEMDVEDCLSELDIEAFDAVQAMLAHMHRKQDITPLMDEIRFRFGSADAMFKASRHLWERIGLKRSEAMLFGLMVDIARYTQRTSYGKRPRLCRLHESSDYLLSNFKGLQVERFYLFCINHRGCLKERLLLHEGVDDGILFSLSKLLAEVVRVSPAAVLVAHNHPGGTTRPSQDDINCTVDIINALSTLEIPLMDHVIAAGHDIVSMRDNGFIPEDYWMAQSPTNRFLRDWLVTDASAAKPARSRKKSTTKKE